MSRLNTEVGVISYLESTVRLQNVKSSCIRIMLEEPRCDGKPWAIANNVPIRYEAHGGIPPTGYTIYTDDEHAAQFRAELDRMIGA